MSEDDRLHPLGHSPDEPSGEAQPKLPEAQQMITGLQEEHEITENLSVLSSQAANNNNPTLTG